MTAMRFVGFNRIIDDSYGWHRVIGVAQIICVVFLRDRVGFGVYFLDGVIVGWPG